MSSPDCRCTYIIKSLPGAAHYEEAMSKFVRQTAFDVEYAPARICKWKSSRTGLQLTYINQPSPIVNGYFAVATEIDNDSGCPHTLEHLVFMGSKDYPYKGFLDSLGNRFFSSTNAWTSVDQTVYTLTTAGWEGFKTLLPVYLDHLLHPTITDEACLTEVYHIDGKGKEKGVVFSEMQGIESQAWFITYLNLMKTLYADKSGYSSETGGLMSELRKLTNDQIRSFHKSMYRPDNLCVVITGSVEENELLEIMSKFDDRLAPLPSVPHKRPFIDSTHDLPLKESVVKTVDFPDEDESMGELVIGWIGPESDKVLENLAVDMVGSYLSDQPISILNKQLVEVENPLATDISYGTDDFVRTGLNLSVSGVPTASLEEVDEKIKAILKEQTSVDNLDLKYMQQVVNQQTLKYIANTEKDPSTFSNVAILEFIYGKTDSSDLARWTKDLKEFETLRTWTTEQWCEIIDKYFVKNASATILGNPSTKLNKQMKAENKARANKIKSELGPDGLLEKKKRLEDAQTKNDQPIPDEIITSFGKPDPSKIQFISTDSYRGGSNNAVLGEYKNSGDFFDIIKLDESIPLNLHFEDYKSKFVTIHLMMTATPLRPELLKYFSVMEEIFNLSIKLPDGKYLPYESVISGLNDDLIDYQFDNGFDRQFVELPSIKVKFENSKFDKAIDWLINVMKYTVFEETRVKIIIEKIINSLPDKKRSEELMMYSLQYRTIFNDSSLRKSQDCINTEQFYKDLLALINEGKFSDILSDLEEIRSGLFSSNNMKIYVVGGCSELNHPVSSWAKFYKELKPVEGKESHVFDDIPRAYQFATKIGRECSNKAYVVASPAGETTHLSSLTPIPTDYLNEDIFKIALANEYLGGVEGPFWRGIRGTGLAYGANMRGLVESGFLSFTIYRGADAEQAWNTGKEIISNIVNGKVKIDQVSLENSVAAIVNELANSESNTYDAAVNKITDHIFKKRGVGYLKHFLSKLNSYTSDDMVYIMTKYFLPLFTSKSSLVFACVPVAKSDEFQNFLQKQGYEVSLEELNASALGDGEGPFSDELCCDLDCDLHCDLDSDLDCDLSEDNDSCHSLEESEN